MQDAVNLGWKLAAAVHGWAPEGLLDTYQSERYPVGQRVMMQSSSQTALIAPGPEVAALRTLFGELLAKPEVAAHIAHLLAGSDVAYDVGDSHPLSGRFVPDVVGSGLLRDGRPVLLDGSHGAVAMAAPGWCDRVDIVAASKLPAQAMLVRPDGYIVWTTDGFTDPTSLHSALRRWFGDSG